MKAKYFWIKERHNPQLGVYYVPMGNLPVKEAKRYENSIYGYNWMLRFSSKEEYEAKLKELRESGERVQA